MKEPRTGRKNYFSGLFAVVIRMPRVKRAVSRKFVIQEPSRRSLCTTDRFLVV